MRPTSVFFSPLSGPSGAVAGATDDVEPVPPGSPRGSMMEGVQGLILQLQEAAPSKL